MADSGDVRQHRGTITEILPHALYRVRLESEHQVVAHAREGIRKNFVRLIEGDLVLVELGAADLGRGRIVRKL